MAARRKPGRITRSTMDRSEWDFERIPTGELMACFCWEYGRQLTEQWPLLQKSILMVKTPSALERHRNTADSKPLGLFATYWPSDLELFQQSYQSSFLTRAGTTWT